MHSRNFETTLEEAVIIVLDYCNCSTSNKLSFQLLLKEKAVTALCTNPTKQGLSQLTSMQNAVGV